MSDMARFQQLMEEGTNAYWDRDWSNAIDAYSEAVQIMPDDADAHVNLGLALVNNGQLDEALTIYKKAQQLSPDDPLPLERCGDVLERMDQPEEAAKQYIKVADVYLGMRDLNKAIDSWERATALTSGLISIHARLAQAYERIGDKPKAIREYLTLADSFARQKNTQKAIRAVERALRLDKNNANSLNALRALRSGNRLNLPDSIVKRERPKPKAMPKDVALDTGDREQVGEANPMGPIGEAVESALELMAQFVVETGTLDQSVMFAMQGMEAQRQDDFESAIAAYEQAIQGMRHVSIMMNLGGLLVLEEEPEQAIQYLTQVSGEPTLVAGALHGLGLSYFMLDDQLEASQNLVQSLRMVDTALASSEHQADEIGQVYDRVLATLDGRSDEALRVINERFVKLLNGKDWKQRIPESRRQLDETLRDEGGQGLVDFLSAQGTDDLADIVTLIDRYIRRGLYTLAMEEAHHAVEKSPLYLPIHVRMAEVMMKEGRIRQAINKYNTVARSYIVREEYDRAAGILEEVLEMAPLDVDIRISLIELLENENRQEEALHQYIDLAETYQQLGNFDMASSTFKAAEQLAVEVGAPPEQRAEIKHYLADISQMRLNTRKAQKTYEDILDIAPKDERALRALIDIYYTQGNQVDAIRRLDVLLSVYAKAGRIEDIVKLLEQLVQNNPSDTGLRKRLAQIYSRRGKRQAAIEQLDALGELQLEAGLTKEAAQTIKQIIALKPDRVEDYQRLLAQLGG